MNRKRSKIIAFCLALLLSCMPLLSYADVLDTARYFPTFAITGTEKRLPVGQAFTLTAAGGTGEAAFRWQYSLKSLAAFGIWYDVTQETAWASQNSGSLTVSQEFSNSYAVIDTQEGAEATVFRCLVTQDGKTQRTEAVCPQFYAATAIQEVKIAGFTEPQKGDAASFAVTIQKERNETVHYDITSVKWLRKAEGTWTEMKDGEKFADGVYRLDVSLTAKDNYVFSFDEETGAHYTVDGIRALRRKGENSGDCVLTLTRTVGEGRQALNTETTFTKTDAKQGRRFTVLYDGVPNTFSGVRGTLLEGTVVEGIEAKDGFLTYRFGTETGEIYLGYLAETDEPCDEPITVITEYGEAVTKSAPQFYRIVKDTFINTFHEAETLPVGILKEGEVFLSEGEITQNGASWLQTTYHGVPCVVSREDAEPLSDRNALLPVITTELSDVQVLEGETAVFTFEAEVPLKSDLCAGLAGREIPRLAERKYTPAFYFFVSDLDFTEIETQGWGEVEWSPESSTLTIKNCSDKLNGMTLRGAVQSFDTVYTAAATLTVRKEAEPAPEDMISEADISVDESTGGVTSLAGNLQVIDAGLNREGERKLLVAPAPGKRFTDDVQLNILSDKLTLKECELLKTGMLSVALTVLPKMGCEATDEEKLLLSEKLIRTREGESIEEAWELLNCTEKTPEFSLGENETLPEGLSLDPSGKIVGTASEGTSGVYYFTMKAKTEPVLITEKKTELVWEYARVAYPAEELVGNADIRQTVTAGELAEIRSAGKTQYFTEGLYTYGVTPLDNGKWDVTFTSARADYPVGAGKCKTTIGADGSLSFTHKGSYLKQTVRYETTPVQVERVVTEEVISEPVTQSVMTLVIAPKHEHTFAVAEKSFLCDLEGEIHLICECGEERTVTVAKRAHTFGAFERLEGKCADASETSKGGVLLQRVCRVCDLHEQAAISETGHQDLDRNGLCDYCGESLRVEKLSRVTGISPEDVREGKLTPENRLEIPEKKLTQQPWFLPAVIVGGILVLALIIIVILIAGSKKERRRQRRK